MVNKTDNHNLDVDYAKGDAWDYNDEMQHIEERLVVRDTETNRTNYTPHSGAIFIATDTGAVYDGDGNSWNAAGEVRTDEEVQDAVASLVAGGANVSITYDDAGNSLTVDTSALDAEEVRDEVGTLLTAGSGISITVDDANDTITITGTYADEDAQDAVGTILQDGLEYDDANNTIGQNVVASGQVTLSSGTGVVDTGISATDATFQLALGIDDPAADAKITGRLFWDDSAGTYKVEFVEDGTSVGNPTVNYDIVRVR